MMKGEGRTRKEGQNGRNRRQRQRRKKSEAILSQEGRNGRRERRRKRRMAKDEGPTWRCSSFPSSSSESEKKKKTKRTSNLLALRLPAKPCLNGPPSPRPLPVSPSRATLGARVDQHRTDCQLERAECPDGLQKESKRSERG